MNQAFFDKLEKQAKSDPKRIALPESDNEMIIKAAREVVDRGIGIPLLIGSADQVEKLAASIGITTDGFQYYDHTDEAVISKLADDYVSLYEGTKQSAVIRRAADALNCAMYLAKLGVVDCVAAGRIYTTADVIISAQRLIGMKDGVSLVSSIGVVDAPGFNGSEGSMLCVADCAITPFPDSGDLADIAISSADTVKTILDWEPRIAMLAFSTCGSSEDDSIDTIYEAIRLVRERRPDLKIDGEFQLDTALLPETAKAKVKRDSDVAGKANILIFPNLHAGNIGVKLIQIFGKADAYGPVLQGFAIPVCDFSRSAPLSEMIGNILMLVVRAQRENKK